MNRRKVSGANFKNKPSVDDKKKSLVESKSLERNLLNEISSEFLQNEKDKSKNKKDK